MDLSNSSIEKPSKTSLSQIQLPTRKQFSKPEYIPNKWHTEAALFELEKKAIFNKSPQYVGHTSMVPEIGDYQTLEHYNHSKFLIHNKNGIELFMNVCRHRQSTLLTAGRGKARKITCPAHLWSYGLDGELQAAPHFSEKPCLNLLKSPVHLWNGMIFEGEENKFDKVSFFEDSLHLNFDDYIYFDSAQSEVDYNWKIFMDIYLEIYHINAIHPGLRRLANVNKVKWDFGPMYSAQTVDLKDTWVDTSEAYFKYKEGVQNHLGSSIDHEKVVWFTYYPNIMIEFYPLHLVISVIIPLSAQKSLNVVDFLHHKDLKGEEGLEIAQYFKRAYLETAVEDDAIGLRMQQGRNILAQEGMDDQGPFQGDMEAGLPHFYAYWNRVMSASLL